MPLRCPIVWPRFGHEAFASFRDVTRFMLARAVALRQGTASGETPLSIGPECPPHRYLPRGV
jgi:hypothetical protein